VRDVVHNAAGSTAHFDRYDGVITLAQYQAGRPPYDSYDGESGGFVLDDDGAPIQQRTEDVPFVLTVPKGPMPATGWCVVINGHGTGGDLESGVGTRAGDESFRLKEAGCAMMAISEPLHRTREGHREGQEETLTFNFFNPLAGRDNWRQSALEKVQQVTALSTLSFTGVGGATVRMDPTRSATSATARAASSAASSSPSSHASPARCCRGPAPASPRASSKRPTPSSSPTS
jgi:hypothetical protein